MFIMLFIVLIIVVAFIKVWVDAIRYSLGKRRERKESDALAAAAQRTKNMRGGL